MSRNGSGTYSLPAGNPVVTGTTLSSTTHNTTMSDLATAITQSLASDGQTVPVANLQMGSFRHTGVGNAAARTDYASAGQVQDGALTALSTVAGTDTITAVAPVGMIAYATGQLFSFVSAGANTGAATIDINGIGAKAITKNGAISLAAGDLAVNRVHLIRYDGTQFQLLNQRSRSRGADIASAGTLNLDAATGDLIDVTGTTAITAITLADGAEITTRFTGILTLTNGASLVNLTGANITTAVGDFATWRGYASGVVRMVDYVRADGRYPIMPSQSGNSGKALVTNGTSESWGYPTQLSTSSGSAPSYAARAFVNFDGTGTVAIRASGNVSSITDSGVGVYAVNFSTAMPDTNYAVAGVVGNPSAGSHVVEVSSSGVTTSTCNILCTGGGSAADFPWVSIAIFR